MTSSTTLTGVKMASNKDIAIAWAIQYSKQDKLVYSDKFFNPFNDNMRKVIVRTLKKQGIVAWWDTKEGAFIFKENDPRFITKSTTTHTAGVWCDQAQAQVITFPILEAAE
jgi:hypothetical protein